MTDQLPRRFYLQRDHDVSGVSGTGTVAHGVMWADGTASVRWTGERPSVVFWDGGMADAEAVHGHGGATRIVFVDAEPTAYQTADDGCPHCPDGHTPPTGGSQSWAAWITTARDGDGQPTTIHVARSAGAHVAEADAQWIRDTLNGRTTGGPHA